MAKKWCRPEEIVAKLRQVEVLQSQGMAAADAIRQTGVSEHVRVPGASGHRIPITSGQWLRFDPVTDSGASGHPVIRR